MGYTGIAARDSVGLNSFALSQWRHISTTRVIIGMNYKAVDSDLPNNQTAFSSTANFDGMNIAIPLVSKKWIFGMSITPYSEVDYKSRIETSSNGENFTQVTSLTGDITRAQFALTYSPHPKVGISGHYTYYFGTVRDQYDFIDFESDEFREVTHQVNYRFTGPGFGMGFDVIPHDRITIAGFVDFAANVDLDVEYVSPLEQSANAERNFNNFPMQFGIGSLINVNNRVNLALDYSMQDWSDALSSSNSEFDTWSNLGFGVERTAKRGRNVGFFQRNDFRSGFSMRKLGYKFNDESVSEMALHLGIGIPFGNYQNRVDFSILGGLRGDINKNLAEERFVEFNVAIAVGEKWFQRLR